MSDGTPNVRRDWYPSVWRPTPEFVAGQNRPTLTAENKNVEATFDTDDRYLRFDNLSPEFAEDFGSQVRWANVVKLRDWVKPRMLQACTRTGQAARLCRRPGRSARLVFEDLVVPTSAVPLMQEVLRTGKSACVCGDDLKDRDPYAAADMAGGLVWSPVHGIAALGQAQRLHDGDTTRLERLTRAAVDAVLTSPTFIMPRTASYAASAARNKSTS